MTSFPVFLFICTINYLFVLVQSQLMKVLGPKRSVFTQMHIVFQAQYLQYMKPVFAKFDSFIVFTTQVILCPADIYIFDGPSLFGTGEP